MNITLFIAGFCTGLAIGLVVAMYMTRMLKEVRQEQFRLRLEAEALRAKQQELLARMGSRV